MEASYVPRLARLWSMGIDVTVVVFAEGTNRMRPRFSGMSARMGMEDLSLGASLSQHAGQSRFCPNSFMGEEITEGVRRLSAGNS